MPLIHLLPEGVYFKDAYGAAGSGFSGTISTIQEMQPDAAVVEDGLHIPMGDVAEGRRQIEERISRLGI